jgi:hypothetical protein
MERALDLALFFLRPKQEPREEQDNGGKSCKQAQEQGRRELHPAEPVGDGHRNEAGRDQGYGDGGDAPAELVALNGKE